MRPSNEERKGGNADVIFCGGYSELFSRILSLRRRLCFGVAQGGRHITCSHSDSKSTMRGGTVHNTAQSERAMIAVALLISLLACYIAKKEAGDRGTRHRERGVEGLLSSAPVPCLVGRSCTVCCDFFFLRWSRCMGWIGSHRGDSMPLVFCLCTLMTHTTSTLLGEFLLPSVQTDALP